MNTSLIVIGIIVLVLALLFVLAKRKMKSIAQVENHERILTLTDANFTHQIKDNIVLVDFWADWCMPCKMMAPILNDLAANLPEGYTVGKLDVDKNQATAQRFNVRSIPTLVLFKDGKEINRFVGVKTKDFLRKEMMR